MSITLGLVPDYETCKKAYDMGLRLNTLFHIFYYDLYIRCNDNEYFEVTSKTLDTLIRAHVEVLIPAPTAEEVPLPFSVFFKHKEHSYMLRQTNLYLALENTSAPVSYYDEYACNFSVVRPNEASARLRMAIRIIEKIPEAKQWYIDNGYLKDGE